MKIEDYLAKQGDNSFQKSSSSTTLLTHKNCPDGAASAVLIKTIDPSALSIPTTHDRINKETIHHAEELPPGGRLLIADIAPSKDTLYKTHRMLTKKDGFLGVYDHHETTKWLADIDTSSLDNLEIIFDDQRCGSQIVFDRFLKSYPEIEKYRDYIAITNDRDLWLKKDKRSYPLALLHKILGDEAYVQRFLKNPAFEGTEEEKIKIRFFAELQHRHLNTLLKQIAIKKDERGYNYGVIYGDGDSSTLLNDAIQKHNLEYALLVNLNTKKVSIRSRGNMDCAAYSKKWGGGGHKKASGFQIAFDFPQF